MKYYVIPVTSFNQNCSIVWCETSNEAILVDPGGEKEKIHEKIVGLKLKLKKIILTHGHIDHVGCAYDLKKYYNVPIFGPNKADQFLLNNLILQCEMLNIKPIFNSIITPDIWLEDQDYIHIGNEVFMVLHCPGHSPGHIVLWNKIQKFIFMGDVLFRNSIGRSDLPGGNIKILIKSIKTKLLSLGDDIVFLPGHGPHSTIGHERLNNPFLLQK